ncbi:MAG: hypothetical protein ABIQ72_11580 [Usitatibacter sp.]
MKNDVWPSKFGAALDDMTALPFGFIRVHLRSSADKRFGGSAA